MVNRGAGEIRVDISGKHSVQEALRQALHEDRVRVVDLFRDWDEDGEHAGTVTSRPHAGLSWSYHPLIPPPPPIDA